MDLEARLHSLRPCAPPPALRARVLAACRPWRPWWLLAAAAIWIALGLLNARLDRAPSLPRRSVMTPRGERAVSAAPAGPTLWEVRQSWARNSADSSS